LSNLGIAVIGCPLFGPFLKLSNFLDGVIFQVGVAYFNREHHLSCAYNGKKASSFLSSIPIRIELYHSSRVAGRDVPDSNFDRIPDTGYHRVVGDRIRPDTGYRIPNTKKE